MNNLKYLIGNGKKPKRRDTAKNQDSQKNMIIIAIIIIVILVLLGVGIGIYLYMRKSSTSSIVQEENNIRTVKILDLPGFFYKSIVPTCTDSCCLKVGESIYLNKILKSISGTINIIIKNNLSQEERGGFQKIFGEDLVESEEGTSTTDTYYLLFYNTYVNVYKYINIRLDRCRLMNNGLLYGHMLIKFIGYKCTINNNTYFCDLTYLSSQNYVLLCDKNALPVGIITNNDYIYLKNTNNVQSYALTNIGYILITTYSILVFNITSNSNVLIGIISII